jgi:hypothetical protein
LRVGPAVFFALLAYRLRISKRVSPGERMTVLDTQDLAPRTQNSAPSAAQHKWVSNIARHAREGGHPDFLSGFPLREWGNDVLDLWTPNAAELYLAQLSRWSQPCPKPL